MITRSARRVPVDAQNQPGPSPSAGAGGAELDAVLTTGPVVAGLRLRGVVDLRTAERLAQIPASVLTVDPDHAPPTPPVISSSARRALRRAESVRETSCAHPGAAAERSTELHPRRRVTTG